MKCQKLILKDHLINLVKSGEKSFTIRRGIRKINLEKLIFESDINPDINIEVLVKNVSFLKLKDISINLIMSNGYKNFNQFIKQLKIFYPDLSINEDFTIIQW